MRKHRTKLVLAAAVICLLAAAWGFGGNYADRGGEAEAAGALRSDAASEAAQSLPPAARMESARADASRSAAESLESESAEAPAGAAPEDAAASAPRAPDVPPARTPDPGADKDQYLTDPVPDGGPLPVEPQDAVPGDGVFTATLTVRCDTILDNTELLDAEKRELVPADGVILETTEVTFYEGESVFNVLQREMKRAKIHMEFVNTPIYNSAYIEGIGNLYEFDAGELSGWMYKVNGWYPNYGCSRYSLKDGDAIEWHYTCDLGRDLGAEWLGGRMPQRDA
ncbi:MAG: DUF4430 domain-containing protein [Clostridiales Family XIII bacterium]|jgi:hypothetical protein|nr:DUF4430 domain-containing protein [Clostridiales Family XIII bacterium]